jgi:hypothetical protein
MADLKISALPASTTPLAGTEVLPIVQGGATKQVSVANLTAGRAVATAGGSFTDNITQSTAAKGINFTANTPKAGMTSQLLNFYEEGTWTPVVASTLGTITSYTSSAVYTRIGRTVINLIRVDITDNGTGAGGLIVSGFPHAVALIGMSGATREDTATGIGICASQNTSTSIYVASTINTYPVATGQGFTIEITQSV